MEDIKSINDKDLLLLYKHVEDFIKELNDINNKVEE